MIERYAGSLRNTWSDEARFRKFLEVELAVINVLEQKGVVPEGTHSLMSNIVKGFGEQDMKRIRELEVETKHEPVAILRWLEEQSPEMRWVHYGLTSSDVTDTVFALQLQEAMTVLIVKARALRDVIRTKAIAYKHTPTIGRTHGAFAEPTTLGLKFLSWFAEMERHICRLWSVYYEVTVAKMSGAVGTFAHLSPEVERLVCANIGLTCEDVATQVIPRDRHAALFCALAQLASSLERFATEVRHLSRSEVGEMAESFGVAQVGSSAMPHKRNPITCEKICGLARLVRGYATAALENVALWHERDISHSSVERVIAPDATGLVEHMLDSFKAVVENLVVDEDQVRANLDVALGVTHSQALMLRMVMAGAPRQQALEAVREACTRLDRGDGEHLRDVAMTSDAIRAWLPESSIRQVFEQDLLANVDSIFDHVLFASR